MAKGLVMIFPAPGRSCFVRVLVAMLACKAVRAGDYSHSPFTVDSAGGVASSTHYRISTTAGSIGSGIPAADSPDYRVRGGFIGQLVEAEGLTMALATNQIPEGSSTFARVLLQENDGSSTFLASTLATWESQDPSKLLADTNGWITAGAVPVQTNLLITARHQGWSASQTVTVLDLIPDNFGIYGQDGLPDAWQFGYFGESNMAGMANFDADGDDQSNAHEYVSGTNPTDTLSRFTFAIAMTSGVVALTIHPRLADRTYSIEATESLTPGLWLPVSAPHEDSGLTRKISDPDLEHDQKFYRARIQYP